MNKLTPVLAGVAFMLAVASAGLLLSLRSERTQLAQALDSRRVLEEKARSLAEEKATLERRFLALRRARREGPAAAPDLDAPDLDGPTAQASRPGGLGDGSRAVPRAQPLPEMTKTQQKASARGMYGELLNELSLSSEQQDQLLDVLTAADARMRERLNTYGPIDLTRPPDPAAMRAAMEAQRRGREAAVAGVLGPELAARFGQLERSIPARIELREMRSQLDAAGLPVSDEQKSQLVRVMEQTGQAAPPEFKPGASESMEDAFTRFRAERAERERQFFARAAAVLTPEQLEHLRAFQELRAATMERAPNEE